LEIIVLANPRATSVGPKVCAQGELQKMKVKIAMGLLLGAALMLASPARATRTDSGYGLFSSTETVSGIGEEWLVPFPNLTPQPGDVLLQISSTSSDLGDPINVTLDLSSVSFVTIANGFTVDTPNFGMIDCAGVGSLSNLHPICGSSTNDGSCDLSGAKVVGDTITLPGTCIVGGATFYFDEADGDDANGNFVGTFADVSPATSAVMPEPGSLALLGMGLLPVVFLAKRREQA
jgi:hypothetical protein